MIVRTQLLQVIRIQRRNGLKGQQAGSPGQRPGCKDVGILALKGQKPYLVHYAFALSGRGLRIAVTQGDALGYLLTGLSGYLCRACNSRVRTTIN